MMVKHRRSRLKKWLFVASLVFVAALVLGGRALISNLSGRAQGTSSLVTLNYSPQETAVNFNPSPVPVHNKYIVFSYPKSFQLDNQQNPTDSINIVSYRYKFRAQNTWQLGVAVERLPSPQLSSDSGYVYRTEHPEKYQLTATTINGQPYIVATDTTQTGFNKVAYALHGNLLGIIALTGYESSDNTDLTKTFNLVLATWHWL